jgi:hypothetical protein
MTTTSTTITYVWAITGLTTVNSNPQYPQAVNNVMWMLTANRGYVLNDQAVTLEGVVAGNQIVPNPTDPNTYINFNNLTESEIVTWVQTQLGSDAVVQYENQAVANIQSQIDIFETAAQYQPLPWRTS